MVTAKKKKAKKSVAEGVAHIHATFNNTIITITEERAIQFLGLLLVVQDLEVQEKAHLLQLR